MVWKGEVNVVRSGTEEIKVMCMRLKNVLSDKSFPRSAFDEVLHCANIQTMCYFCVGFLSSSLN